jgi:hypothetical protein
MMIFEITYRSQRFLIDLHQHCVLVWSSKGWVDMNMRTSPRLTSAALREGDVTGVTTDFMMSAIESIFREKDAHNYEF